MSIEIQALPMMTVLKLSGRGNFILLPDRLDKVVYSLFADVWKIRIVFLQMFMGTAA